MTSEALLQMKGLYEKLFDNSSVELIGTFLSGVQELKVCTLHYTKTRNEVFTSLTSSKRFDMWPTFLLWSNSRLLSCLVRIVPQNDKSRLQNRKSIGFLKYSCPAIAFCPKVASAEKKLLSICLWQTVIKFPLADEVTQKWIFLKFHSTSTSSDAACSSQFLSFH